MAYDYASNPSPPAGDQAVEMAIKEVPADKLVLGISRLPKHRRVWPKELNAKDTIYPEWHSGGWVWSGTELAGYPWGNRTTELMG